MNEKTDLGALVDEIGQIDRLIKHLQVKRRILQQRLRQLTPEYSDVVKAKGHWYELVCLPTRTHPAVLPRKETQEKDLQFPDPNNLVMFAKKNQIS